VTTACNGLCKEGGADGASTDQAGGEVKVQVAAELLDRAAEDEAPKLEASAFSPGGTLLDRAVVAG
jgi:hypothetical protein